MKILNQHQIREADQQTIALEPISSIALMEKLKSMRGLASGTI